MIVLVLISLLTLCIYIGVMVKRNGIPSSVSDTFYSLKHKLWFGVSMIVSSFILLPAILEFTPEKYQFIAFLACAGMAMVGVSPNFKEDFERPIHVIGATMVLIFSQIWVALIDSFFLLAWIPFIVYTIYGINKNWDGDFISSFDKTNPLFWVEIVAIFTTYSCLIINLSV